MTLNRQPQAEGIHQTTMWENKLYRQLEVEGQSIWKMKRALRIKKTKILTVMY